MGDDTYGDAIAYTNDGVTAYIHDVYPGDANIPPNFKGTLTPNYTPEFRAKVCADWDAAISNLEFFTSGNVVK